MNKKIQFPHIGARIIKSSIAVFICFIFYHFFRPNGIMFYSQLSVLWCIQPLRNGMFNKAIQRITGTLVGALAGLFVILIDINLLLAISSSLFYEAIYALIVSLFIIVVLYTTLVIRKPDASYFSCVVFLSIVVVHIGDASPYLFVVNRLLDTVIGIIIGMAVNSVGSFHKRKKDRLYILGMDDTHLNEEQKLSAFNKYEINKIVSEGTKFTIATIMTPGSLLEALDGVKLKVPVICMDGACMYDTNLHVYKKCYTISKETEDEIRKFFNDFSVNYFANLLLDDTLIIQYKKLVNPAETDVYNKLCHSPFRNYTTKSCPEACCLYFMCLEEQAKIDELVKEFKSRFSNHRLRINSYPSTDYPGYGYIKIYNENATRENMIAYLKQEQGVDKDEPFYF